VDELAAASRFVQFSALSLLVGPPLFRICIQPAGSLAPPTYLIERAAGIAALISALGWLAAVAASMAGGWLEAIDPGTAAAVMLDTRFGCLWIARLALILAIVLLCRFARRTRTTDIVLLALAGIATASLVGVGHGLAGAGPLALIHGAADVLHLLCMATWLGTLFCLALLLHETMAAGDGESDVIRTALPRFSHIGYGAVALLLVSGCVNAFILLPRPDALIGEPYGRILLVKVSLAGLMVAVAIVNRLVLAPRILESKPATVLPALWRNVLIELGTGLLVLATVAVLGIVHPTH
jgi:putative copper resistance protein D